MQEERVTKKNSDKPSKGLIATLIALCVVLFLTISYLFLIYTETPFIAKWRRIYIETAMSTKTHQWLAEWFIPESIIDEVMQEKWDEIEKQKELQSDWEDKEIDDGDEELENETEFYNTFYEVNNDEFKIFLKKHSEFLKDGYDNIVIEDFDKNYDLKTIYGDPIVVLNAKERVIIIEVSGSGYVGKMAIAKDPSRVSLAKSEMLGSYGQEVETFAKKYNAVIAINGSMFADAAGHGTGGIVKGCLVIDGKDYGDPKGDDWRFMGMKEDNKLVITTYKQSLVSEFRWAIQCYPALIVNGESIVDGTFGLGIHPRAAVGQNERGDFFFLVIDGRQVGYSLGTTVSECAYHMSKYGAYQAINIDGGSSAVMYYMGEQITSSSSATGRGRYIPDSIMLLPRGEND